MINRLFIAGAVVALATVTASAADLPSRAAPPVFVPPPVVGGYSWTGVEFGLTTSYAFSNKQTLSVAGNDPFTAGALAAGNRPSFVNMQKSGFDDVGGGIAFNYQFTPGSGIVVGGMADVELFNLTKNVSVFNNPDVFGLQGNESYFHQRLSYLGTVNGRLGYAFDHFLVYGVGGFAFGGTHDAASFYSAGVGQEYYGTNNRTATGYDFGGGAEYAIPSDSFLNNLSVEKLLGFDKTLGLNLFEGTIRAEFIHYNLGSQNVLVNNSGNALGSYTARFKTEGNVVRVGLGYKYGGVAPTPVVARY